jgi:cytochrome c556
MKLLIFFFRRDESLDSGIASHDSTSDYHQMQQQQHDPVFLRRPNQRSRRFEMVPSSSRHKFEIRDLNDFNESSVIVPLALPKLPTERKEIVTNGLIRSTNSYNTDETDMSISGDSRPASFISTASEIDSCEEEKLRIDNSYSEKSLKGAISKLNAHKMHNSNKNPSPDSSKTSWSGNGGESLANKNGFSSISTSSTDDDCKNKNTQRKKDIDCDEDELSTMTITAEHSSFLDSNVSRGSKDQKETVNDAFMRQKQQQPPKMATISRKELFIQVDEEKFAETVAAAKNSALLDDETSPSESLVSSSESGDVLMKKSDDFAAVKKENLIDDIREQDLEDITPELISPGSPTHASNSLSLSDGGRDFFIDDEIAGQPALMISDKKQKRTASHHDDYKSSSIAINAISDGTTTTTPTLKDISINANGSLKSLNKALTLRKNIEGDQSSPALLRKKIERSGSLDTLSPCDSIASDDLMGDFDFASSLDSIDR